MLKTVKLGDIAKEYKNKAEDKTISIGLTHLDSEELKISRWDENAQNTFTKGFKKGHVLFGRRRAYLKKAAVTDFEGVCSGDIIVIEAIEGKVIPEYLPFIIQNDSLFSYAIEKSAGSLSPRVKWAILKEYEFKLPSLEEQKRLANILWKIEENKELSVKAIKSNNQLVESKIINFIKEYVSKSIELQDICELTNGLWVAKKDPKEKAYIIRNTNFSKNCKLLKNNIPEYDVESRQLKTRQLKYGDLILERSGGSPDQPIGRIIYFDINNQDEKYTYSNFTSRLRVYNDNYLSRYVYIVLLAYYLNNETVRMQSQTTGISNLKIKDYMELKIPEINLEKQKQLIDFFDEIQNTNHLILKKMHDYKNMQKDFIL